MNPTTPTGNTDKFFGQKVSVPGINVNNASDSQLILKDDFSTRIYYNQEGVATVLLGLRSANSSNGLTSSEQGLYVSKPAIDVSLATDDQLIFNSGQNVFKIYGAVTFNTTSFSYTCFAGQVQQLTQNDEFNFGDIGFVPAVLCYFLNSDGTYGGFPNAVTNTVVGDNFQWLTLTTNIVITSSSVTVSTTMLSSCVGSGSNLDVDVDATTVYIYLLQESANFNFHT